MSFRKLQVNIPPVPGILTPDRAEEILQRSALAVSYGFENVVVDRPTGGSIFVFMAPEGMVTLPEDGYGYMDDETYLLSANPNGNQIETFTRSLGFEPSDSVCTIKRKRFRLPQFPDLQLMHYSKADEGRPIQVQLIKQKPRQKSVG